MDVNVDMHVNLEHAEPVADVPVEPARNTANPPTQREQKNQIWRFKMLRKRNVRQAKRRKGSKLTAEELKLALVSANAAYYMNHMSAAQEGLRRRAAEYYDENMPAFD